MQMYLHLGLSFLFFFFFGLIFFRVGTIIKFQVKYNKYTLTQNM